MNPPPHVAAEAKGGRKPVIPLALVAVLVLAACVFAWNRLTSHTPVFQGYVEADYLYVAAPVPGRLLELPVRRGDSIAFGKTLFRLEPNPESEQTAEARARLILAEQNRDRARQMLPSGSISRQQYDEAESDWKSAHETLAQIQWRLDQKTQASTCAAYVQDTFYVPGEWVPEGRPVVVLLPPDRLKIRFYVNAATLARLHAGDRITVRPHGLTEPVAATLTYLSSRAEYTPPVIYSNDTRDKLTFLVEAVPDAGPARVLHPGLPVEIDLNPEP